MKYQTKTPRRGPFGGAGQGKGPGAPCFQSPGGPVTKANLELSRCRGFISRGLQVLEGLESSCLLSVLACCFFGRLILFVPAYVCFGLAGCGWVYPDLMPRTLIVGSGRYCFFFAFLIRLMALGAWLSCSGCFLRSICFSGFRSLPLEFCGLFLFSSSYFSFGICFTCTL